MAANTAMEINEDLEDDQDLMTDKPSATAQTTTLVDIAGLIIPPPEIKVIVDRTADFVRRVGQSFEQEIVQRHGRNSKKFQFLSATNPYYPYYQHRIKHGDAAVVDSSGREAPKQAAVPSQEKEEKEKPKPKELTLQEKLQQMLKDARTPKAEFKGPIPPDKFNVRIPEHVQPVDIDIIKWTALFVARNRLAGFAGGLTAREQRNAQFEFLRPTHLLFGFYQNMVEAYAQVIQPQSAFLEDMKNYIADPSKLMEQLLARAAFEKKQRESTEKKEVNAEEEKVLYSSIDWHNFVVVETIQFLPEDEGYLPAPKGTIEEINRMLAAQALEEQQRAEAAQAAQQAGEADMDVDMDQDKPASPVAEPEESREPEEEPEVRTEEEIIEEEKRRQANRATQFATCPVCKELIPVNEIAEHVRIELLDPKWKEQKEAYMNKMKESSLTDTGDMTYNLTRLAKNRPDMFYGHDDSEHRERREKEREEQLKAVWEKQIKQQIDKQTADRGGSVPEKETKKAPPSATIHRAPQVLSAPPMPPSIPQVPVQQMQPPYGMPPMGMAPMPPQGQPPQGMMQPRPPVGMPPQMPMGYGNPNMPMMMPGMPGQFMPIPGAPMTGVLPGMHAPPPMPVADQPPLKKQRVEEKKLVDEADFAKQFSGSYTINVQVPADAENKKWNFNGQILALDVQATESVESLRKKISEQLGGMPEKKMKLNIQGGAFMNDANASLAKYNVGPACMLQVGERTRGGK